MFILLGLQRHLSLQIMWAQQRPLQQRNLAAALSLTTVGWVCDGVQLTKGKTDIKKNTEKDRERETYAVNPLKC